ncbi:MAG: hypothetical protein V4544_01265 [Pseudomonadota bacterium]
MKKIKLFLLSSIFIAYSIQDAMSDGSVVANQSSAIPSAKRIFAKEELQEEADLTETLSDAAQQLEDAKAKKAAVMAELKELAEKQQEKQRELQTTEKEVQEANRAAGNEGADRLKRKILNHSETIKNINEKIKQATTDHTAEIKRLNDEKALQFKEANDNHAIIIKDFNVQKELSQAKKTAREQELAVLKGAKMADPSSKLTNQQIEQKAALNAQIQNQKGKPAKGTAPASGEVKKTSAEGGLGGGIFGGLQAFQDKIANVANTASNVAESATGTLTNAADQANGITNQMVSARKSVKPDILLQSIKIESNTFTVKTISI